MTTTDDIAHQTRERILSSALPIFAELGFAGASTRRLAGSAQVNVATLAYHFEGKEGLYLAVLERLYEDLAAALPAAIDPSADPFADLARRAWSFCREHRLHIRLMLRHVLDEGQHPDAVVGRWTEPLLAGIEARLAPLRPGWGRARTRLFVLGVMHMLVRLTIEEEGQLRLMLGGTDDLDAEVVGWLTELLRRELTG